MSKLPDRTSDTTGLSTEIIVARGRVEELEADCNADIVEAVVNAGLAIPTLPWRPPTEDIEDGREKCESVIVYYLSGSVGVVYDYDLYKQSDVLGWMYECDIPGPPQEKK